MVTIVPIDANTWFEKLCAECRRRKFCDRTERFDGFGYFMKSYSVCDDNEKEKSQQCQQSQIDTCICFRGLLLVKICFVDLVKCKNRFAVVLFFKNGGIFFGAKGDQFVAHRSVDI